MAFGVKIKITPEVNLDAAVLQKKIQTAFSQASKNREYTIKGIKLQLADGELQRAINKARSKEGEAVIRQVGIEFSKTKTKAAFNALQREFKQTPLVVKIDKIDASGAIKKLRADLKTMLSGLNVGGMRAFLGDDASAAAVKSMEQVEKRIAQAQKNIRKEIAATSAAKKELNTLSAMATSSRKKIDSLPVSENEVNNLIAKYRVLNRSIEKARGLEGQTQMQAISRISKEVNALQQKIQAYKDAGAAAKKSAVEAAAAAGKESENIARAAKLREQITTYINKNGAAYKAYSAQFDSMLSKLSGGAKLSKEEIDKLALGFTNLKTQAQEANLTGATLMETLKNGAKRLANWALITNGLILVTKAFRGIIDNVHQLDDAMLELRKVTDLTEGEYKNFQATALDVARNVNATMADTINATADFARLGYSVEDASELAEAALVYKNVGDGITDVSVATESLISTIKAFGDGTYSAMEIVDKFNEVGKLLCPAA